MSNDFWYGFALGLGLVVLVVLLPVLLNKARKAEKE
jgi:hypothetical protein